MRELTDVAVDTCAKVQVDGADALALAGIASDISADITRTLILLGLLWAIVKCIHILARPARS